MTGRHNPLTVTTIGTRCLRRFEDVIRFTRVGFLDFVPAIDRHPRAKRLVRTDRRVRDEFTVHPQLRVFVLDAITWQTNDAFDPIFAWTHRRTEHCNITTLRLRHRNHFRVRNRQADTVFEFIDENEIARQQRRHHRIRWDFEGLNDETAHAQNHQQNREKRLRIIHIPRLVRFTGDLVETFALLRPEQLVQQPNDKRQCGDGNENFFKPNHDASFSLKALSLICCPCSKQRGTLPAGSQHDPLASCASCLLSASQATSSYA